jgi:hypothetical protein
MLHNRSLLFLILVLLSAPSLAQVVDNDSAVGKLNFRDKPVVFFMFDKNYSFVDSKLASTSGFKAGLEFSNKLKLGLGYSWLNSDVVEQKIVITEAGYDTSLNARLTMRLGILYGEYIFYNKGSWQISMPGQIGIGTSYFTYYESIGDDTKKKQLSKQGVLMLNATGMGTYRILKWFGLSAGAGFRIMLIDNNDLKQNLNGPVFAFRVRIFFGEIYKSFLPEGLNNKN